MLFRYNRILLCFLFFLAVQEGSMAFAGGNGSVDRPRLLIDAERVEEMRSEIQGSARRDFLEVKRYVAWRISTTSPSVIAGKHYQPEVTLPIALVAILSGNESEVNYAKSCCLEMASIPPDPGSDEASRFRLLSMAILYDWLQDRYSTEERVLVSASIKNYIVSLSFFLDRPQYSGGHSRFGNIAIMAGAIAVHGESEMTAARSLLERAREQWRLGYTPYQEWVGEDGAYYMGVQYGAGYSSFWPYMIGDRLKYDALAAHWIRDIPLWYIYALRGDETFVRLGDCNDCSIGQYLAPIMAYCSNRFEDRHAEWFYRKYLDTLWGPYRVWRIIYPGHRGSPGKAINDLPLSRMFRGSGIAISRDSWDGNATHLMFKSSPFYTMNHHHKDQNHFELSYRGSLLIDSGYYDHYGSSHWKNYYSRTIAHNTMIVQDPDERFEDGETLSNDGGQKYADLRQSPPGREPESLPELLSDKYRLDGITGYRSVDGITWMRGDASKAYSRGKVESYVREILMINRLEQRQNPVILVLDRIRLRKELLPKILYHSNERPEIEGNRFTISNRGGGMLYGEIISSRKIRVEVVGGPGKEWFVDGMNYPPEEIPRGKGIASDPGNWRIEVGPEKATRKAEYLTVLAVTSSKDRSQRPVIARISGKGLTGIRVERMLVLFDESTGKHSIDVDEMSIAEIGRVVIVGANEENITRVRVGDRVWSLKSVNVLFIGNSP